jgi:hypothetical protein
LAPGHDIRQNEDPGLICRRPDHLGPSHGLQSSDRVLEGLAYFLTSRIGQLNSFTRLGDRALDLAQCRCIDRLACGEKARKGDSNRTQ